MVLVVYVVVVRTKIVLRGVQVDGVTKIVTACGLLLDRVMRPSEVLSSFPVASEEACQLSPEVLVMVAVRLLRLSCRPLYAPITPMLLPEVSIVLNRVQCPARSTVMAVQPGVLSQMEAHE